MKLRTRPQFYRDLAREQLRLLDKAGPDMAEAWRGEVKLADGETSNIEH